MKKTYLLLSTIGFIIPNIFVLKESLATGNILLWLDLQSTISQMFANRISTFFIIDLLFVVGVFFFWSYRTLKEKKRLWTIWLLTMLFGLAGGLPLFLYFKEEENNNN